MTTDLERTSARRAILLLAVVFLGGGMISHGCRRHQPPPMPPPEPLQPTRIAVNTSRQALSGQVTILVYSATYQEASIRLNLPDGTSADFPSMKVGARELVEIQGWTYFLDLHEADGCNGFLALCSAKVSLTPKQ